MTELQIQQQPTSADDNIFYKMPKVTSTFRK